MQIHSFKCPNCDATLEVEDGLEVMYCRYCGAPLQLDGLSDGVLNAKVRIREMEHEERLQDKKYEFKKFKMAEESKEKKLAAIFKEFSGLGAVIAILLLLALLFFPVACSHHFKVAELSRIENEIIADIEKGDYDAALALCSKLRLNDNYSSEEEATWDKKREEYVDLIKNRTGENKDEQKTGDGEKPWWQFW